MKNFQRKNQISKTLSYILRHGAIKYNLHINEYGYIKIDDILNLRQFSKKPKVTMDDIFDIVYDDSKGRYTIKQSLDTFYIKANQGHTMYVPKLELKKITNPNLYPIIIHGTSHKNWLLIKNEGGLKKMKRNHIHLAIGEPHQAKSGIRYNSLIIIYIDLKKAINDGIVFKISPNRVILTDGIEGFLSSKYFLKVYDYKKGKNIESS